MRFPLARMSPLIRALTILFLALPLALLGAVLLGTHQLAVPALLVVIIHSWVWLRFRPNAFVVHPRALEIVWPLKRRELLRDGITEFRFIDRQSLRKEIGWGIRIGAGGLWGAFGWLWTKKRGIVQMYVSRTDCFVWIEHAGGRPWLITPEKPEEFVYALSNDRADV